MSRTIESEVYKFEELSESAKETARTWYREGMCHDFDPSFDDFVSVCDILGITLNTRPVKLYGGGTRHEPDIHYSGFSSQGDGASFAGEYSYKAGATKAIQDFAPLDTVLHGIAYRLQKLQSAAFYRLTASISKSGHYAHEYTMSADVERTDEVEVSQEVEEAILEEMRNVARWIYKQLETEYDYQNSDEIVDESITINEYEFTEEGNIV